MKIYLAGPMSIRPKDFNFPTFFEAGNQLEKDGHTVFNPAKEDIKTWGSFKNVKKYANYRDCLKKDIDWIFKNAEVVAILPGWQKSKGVRVEKALAKALNIPVKFLRKDKNGKWRF